MNKFLSEVSALAIKTVVLLILGRIFAGLVSFLLGQSGFPGWGDVLFVGVWCGLMMNSVYNAFYRQTKTEDIVISCAVLAVYFPLAMLPAWLLLEVA